MAQAPCRRRARVRRQGTRRGKDGPSQGAGRGAEAEGGRQRRGGGDAARQGQGRCEVEARGRGRREGRRQGGRDQEGRRRQGGERGDARARAGLRTLAARRRSFTYGATRISRGEVFDTTIEVPVTIRNPDKPL